jgi:peptide-methionine (S)-S-oxide reductase
LQLELDAQRLPYAELLELFFSLHDPSRPAHGRQYRSAVFTHSDEQRRLAEAARDRRLSAGRPLHTAIEPLREFFLAEDYHQKYRLRRHPELIAALGLTDADLVSSTLAARLNGYVAEPSEEQLAALASQALPAAALAKLRAILAGRF